jgi:hypothetical protein
VRPATLSFHSPKCVNDFLLFKTKRLFFEKTTKSGHEIVRVNCPTDFTRHLINNLEIIMIAWPYVSAIQSIKPLSADFKERIFV